MQQQMKYMKYNEQELISSHLHVMTY